jgi:hypothetical protein
LLNGNTRTALVDILERDTEGKITLSENGKVKTHTVLLYKNPSTIKGNEEIIVIDPSSIAFSAHLSGLSNNSEFQKNFPKQVKISTPGGKLQIYKPKEAPGPDVSRDCIDIAVKLAFGLNTKPQNFSIQPIGDSLTNAIKAVDIVQHISNVKGVDGTIFEDSITRIKQASDTKLVELFHSLQKHFLTSLTVISKNLLSTAEFAELLSEYGNILSTKDHTETLQALVKFNEKVNNKISSHLHHTHDVLSKSVGYQDDYYITGSGTSSYLDNSYWNRYSLKAMKDMLALRLQSAGIDIEDVRVIHPNYTFSEETSQAFIQNLVSQISAIVVGTWSGSNAEQKLLIPLNLYGKHWVGMTIEFADGRIKVTYMDSEGNAMPKSLSECLTDELTWIYPNAGVEVTEKVVELQNSNNCGLHVIENLIAAVAGEAARIDQENVLAVHATLYEQAVLEEAWQQGQTKSLAAINNEQKPIGEVSLAQRDTKQPVTHHHPATDQQAKAELWYSGAEKVIASMAEKVAGSFVDTLRMAMYVSPHDASDVMRSALHAGGCDVPANPYSPEFREMLSQHKFANSSKSFSDRDKFPASLPSSSLLDGIELTRGDAETWLQQLKSEAPLLGE